MVENLGNGFCIFICIFESFFFIGIWQGFGMMTNILKKDGLFKCEETDDPNKPDCTDRDNVLGTINVVSNDTEFIIFQARKGLRIFGHIFGHIVNNIFDHTF